MAWVRIPPLPVFLLSFYLGVECIVCLLLYDVCRQQIEDLEKEVTRLKDVVKKKEENERKYQGKYSVLLCVSEE